MIDVLQRKPGRQLFFLTKVKIYTKKNMGEELKSGVEKIVKINDAEWEAFQSILKPKQIKKHALFWNRDRYAGTWHTS
jgi:hypothetical protein